MKDDNSLHIGKMHANPLIDSRLYEIEISDRSYEACTANLITEMIYAQQLDDKGNTYTLLDAIIDHCCTDDQAVKLENGWIQSKSSNTGRRQP